jgi:hypothetical protein
VEQEQIEFAANTDLCKLCVFFTENKKNVEPKTKGNGGTKMHGSFIVEIHKHSDYFRYSAFEFRRR